MYKLLGLDESLRFFVYLMLSFSFFVGILLIVSQEAFVHFNKALQKEIGLRKRIIPQLENKEIQFIDLVILKYRLFCGILISVSAFLLLLIYKF